MSKFAVFVLVFGAFVSADAQEHDEIFVEFFEGQSDVPFSASNVPIDRLPDTFEIQTTLHLGEDEWVILAAEPAQKAEFRATGSLRVYLAKAEIQQIDPSELLFSLPTISDDLAAVENADSLEDVAIFREDDWRQFEFVDVQYATSIQEELSSISRIYDEHRNGLGFREIHVRERIKAPLSKETLTLDAVVEHFSVSHEFAGVAFDSTAAKIVGGFALSTESGWVLWGQADESGTLLTLNLSPSDQALNEGINEKVDLFLEAHGLYVVDWVRLFWGGPGHRLFSEYGN
jgi:hypothetical protein